MNSGPCKGPWQSQCPRAKLFKVPSVSDQAASYRPISCPNCARSNPPYLAGASVSTATSCDVDVAGARTVSFSSNRRGPIISAEGGCAILQAYARVPPRSPARPLTSSRFSHDRLRVASPHGYTAPGGAAPSPASAPAPRAQLWLKPGRSRTSRSTAGVGASRRLCPSAWSGWHICIDNADA